MPTRIELPKELVKSAFVQKQQSLRRAITQATNALVKSALDDELSQITKAIDTMTETK